MKEEKLMKKILAVAGSLMLAASVLMTGCGGGGGGDKKAADANKEWKPTKSRFRHGYRRPPVVEQCKTLCRADHGY